MDALVGEWLNLVIRWTHVIAGIAWIGSSFYFNWLDAKLRPPSPARPKVEGEAWLVHSGGFYRVEKIDVAPQEIPAELHWFKWEAAFTWITGFLLLILLYHLGQGAFLQDAPQGFSDLLGIGGLIVGLSIAWTIYDLAWKSPLGDKPLLAGGLLFALLIAAAWGLSQVMTGQAAYLHVGAALGTIMTANVWMRIIPAQRALVAAARAGAKPEARLGKEAKKRSIHNNYMTLPVVFVMLSTHFASTWGHEWNWAVLAALMLVGAAVRHAFNLRNRGRNGLWILPLAALAMLVLYYVVAAS
ncbi:MAG: urate hydroxylase PuuD [Reyranellaceae bacterium]